jgi:C-terminal processing protease CtpA/Prc
MLPAMKSRELEGRSRALNLGWLVSAAALLILPGGCAAQHGTVGAVLAQRGDGRLLIREAPDNLAAAHAGLKAGDEILLIEGQDVRSMSAAEVHRALSGQPDEAVRLTLLRGDRALRVTVQRTAAVPRRPAAGTAEN